MSELLASHFSYYLCAAQSYDATQKYFVFYFTIGADRIRQQRRRVG